MAQPARMESPGTTPSPLPDYDAARDRAIALEEELCKRRIESLSQRRSDTLDEILQKGRLLASAQKVRNLLAGGFVCSLLTTFGGQAFVACGGLALLPPASLALPLLVAGAAFASMVATAIVGCAFFSKLGQCQKLDREIAQLRQDTDAQQTALEDQRAKDALHLDKIRADYENRKQDQRGVAQRLLDICKSKGRLSEESLLLLNEMGPHCSHIKWASADQRSSPDNAFFTPQVLRDLSKAFPKLTNLDAAFLNICEKDQLTLLPESLQSLCIDAIDPALLPSLASRCPHLESLHIADADYHARLKEQDREKLQQFVNETLHNLKTIHIGPIS